MRGGVRACIMVTLRNSSDHRGEGGGFLPSMVYNRSMDPVLSQPRNRKEEVMSTEKVIIYGKDT